MSFMKKRRIAVAPAVQATAISGVLLVLEGGDEEETWKLGAAAHHCQFHLENSTKA